MTLEENTPSLSDAAYKLHIYGRVFHRKGQAFFFFFVNYYTFKAAVNVNHLSGSNIWGFFCKGKDQGRESLVIYIHYSLLLITLLAPVLKDNDVHS